MLPVFCGDVDNESFAGAKNFQEGLLEEWGCDRGGRQPDRWRTGFPSLWSFCSVRGCVSGNSRQEIMV